MYASWMVSNWKRPKRTFLSVLLSSTCQISESTASPRLTNSLTKTLRRYPRLGWSKPTTPLSFCRQIFWTLARWFDRILINLSLYGEWGPKPLDEMNGWSYFTGTFSISLIGYWFDVQVLYVCRNVKDAAVSYFHHESLMKSHDLRCDFITYAR